MRTTIIARIKTTLPQALEEIYSLFGEGVNQEYNQEEYAFALNNTPVSNGYIRIPAAQHIVAAMGYMLQAGIEAEHIECVRIEWHGQDMVERVDPETGETEIVEELFQTGGAGDTRRDRPGAHNSACVSRTDGLTDKNSVSTNFQKGFLIICDHVGEAEHTAPSSRRNEILPHC